LGRGQDRVADALIATASPDETSQFRFSRPRNHGTSAGINRPLKQMMIRQADIDDQDVVWAASVLPRNHRVQCSAELVRGIGVM